MKAPTWVRVFADSSGPLDVRAARAASYALTALGSTLSTWGNRANYWATRWSLVREHGYTLRGQPPTTNQRAKPDGRAGLTIRDTHDPTRSVVSDAGDEDA